MKKLAISLVTLLLSICAIGQTPVMTMTTTKAIGSTFSFYLTANIDNTSIQVDFGDGIPVNQNIGTTKTIISGTLIGSQTIKIYGSHIDYLDCSNNQITALDITNNVLLTRLDCFNNQLSSIDISKNTALVALYCWNNQLSTLDVTKNIALLKLSCSSNKLTTLNATMNTALTYLYCDHNLLSSLDISKNTLLTELNCPNNQLTALDITKNTYLYRLICSYNQLTFYSLPIKKAALTQYYYAPQDSISIPKSFSTGILFDLSNQLTVNGNATAYNWKTQSGTALLQGTDYTITNGKTVFLKAQPDSVYCEMTNASFPDFNGSNVLKTTYTKVILGTAITDVNAPDIKIYAYHNTLFINIPYNAQISIFETNGRLVVSKPVYKGSNSLQLQNKGIYLVKLIGNEGSVTRKIYIE